MTPEPGNDDTIQTSLLDELLTPASHPAEATQTGPVSTPPEATVTESPIADDDDYLDLTHQRRSRLTTGLVVALIFALGILTGVMINRTFAPTPKPQMVYVLASDAPTPQR